MKKLNKKEEDIYLSNPLISNQEKIEYCKMMATNHLDKSGKWLKISIIFGIIALVCQCILLITKIIN
jgi:hypothetical protein